MKNQITFTNARGEEVTVTPSIGHYSNGTTAIMLNTIDGHFYAALSVNIISLAPWSKPLMPGYITVDTHYCSKELIQAMVDNKVIEISERKIRSGFCKYPIAKVTYK